MTDRCQNCGLFGTLREVRARHPRALSCCPEREVVHCTCHPSDCPPQPCPQKFAYTDCVRVHLGIRCMDN